MTEKNLAVTGDPVVTACRVPFLSLVFCFSIIPGKFVIVISFASYFRLHNVSYIRVHFPHLLFLLFGIASSAVSFSSVHGAQSHLKFSKT